MKWINLLLKSIFLGFAKALTSVEYLVMSPDRTPRITVGVERHSTGTCKDCGHIVFRTYEGNSNLWECSNDYCRRSYGDFLPLDTQPEWHDPSPSRIVLQLKRPPSIS